MPYSHRARYCQDTLTKEETVFDKHVDIVAELKERIERLTVPEEAAFTPTMLMARDLSGKLAIKHIEQQKETITTSMWSPPAETKDYPKLWLQKCQKDIGMISAQLTGIMGEILALPGVGAKSPLIRF